MTDVSSPLIHDDGSVTLSLAAPRASKVELHSDFRLGQEVVFPVGADTFPALERNDGTWTITTEVLLPGIYRYAFLVDGLRVLDPLNPWMRRAEIGQPFSMVRVPGDGKEAWELRTDIAHGVVVRETLYPTRFERPRRCHVYLPPGYDRDRSYPVLYLLHGGSNDYGHWVFDGAADNICDSLIAAGVVTEMIVVMPDGNVLPSQGPRRGLTDETRAQLHSLFPPYFFDDVLAPIERRYRIDSRQRAVAGLSMGCLSAWALVTSRPNLFSAVGLFSGSIGDGDEQLARIGDALRAYFLVHTAVGDHDANRIVAGIRALSSALGRAAIPTQHFETVGGHIWAVWQRALIDFLAALGERGFGGPPSSATVTST